MKLSNKAISSEKKSFVRRMFNDIHGNYDFINTVLSFGMDRRWRNLVIRDFSGKALVADLCGGGGQLSKMLLGKKDFSGTVIIVDLSINMIAAGKRNFSSNFANRAICVVADAEFLPFKNFVFDGAMSAFCLRNLSDLQLFTVEARRVLRRGGMARHLEIAHPGNKLIRTLFEFYFYRVTPFVSMALGGKKYAYKYLPASLKIFPEQSQVCDILGNGWKKASFKNLLGGMAAVYKLDS